MRSAGCVASRLMARSVVGRIEIGKGGVVVVQPPRIVLGQSAVEQQLDQNVAQKAGPKAFVAGQGIANLHGERAGSAR